MTLLQQIEDMREKGIAAYKSGQHFGQCPVEGFGPEAIELRWHWQLGWLRAQQDKWDAEKPKTTRNQTT